MKKLIFALLAVVAIVGCSKDEGAKPNIVAPNESQLTQTVFADQTTGKSEVNFTTTGAWSSSISESATAKSTRAESPDWISIDPASGEKAGSHSINIILSKNFTGEKRFGVISIISGGDKITINITQEAVKEDGTKPEEDPTPDPEPSGEGILTNETTGQKVKLINAKFTDPSSVEFYGEKLYDVEGSEEKEVWFWVEFKNPLVDGKLKLGTYNVSFSGVSPHPNLKDGECYFLKSDLYYLYSGTIKVEAEGDTYTFTFDGVTPEFDGNFKIKGAFKGIPEYHSVQSVSINKTSHTLPMGENIALEATIMPENATNKNYTWASSNPAVATVDENGLVKSVSAGTTIITATSEEGGKTATCTITVNAPIAVQSISVEPKTLSLLKGDNYEFYAESAVTVLPENATNKHYTWASSNESVVYYTGKNIEAKSAGTATITFTTEDGAKTATLTVTVTERQTSGNGNLLVKEDSGKYPDENLTLIEADHTIMSKNRVKIVLKDDNGNDVSTLEYNNPLSSGTLATGTYSCTRTETTNANTAVSNTVYKDWGLYSSGSVTVSKSGENYTFTFNNIKTTNGRTITGSYTGKVNYTNEYFDVTSVQITPTTKTLTIGDNFNLTATVLPDNAFNKNVTWSSSNSDVVSVYDNGYIYARGVGSATITVTTEDGAKTATCIVTVNAKPSTGNGTFSNNNSQSISIKRAEQWVNGKEPKEIDLRFSKENSEYADLEFTLVRGDSDISTLKAGTYSTVVNFKASELGVKYSYTNTGSVTVAVNGDQYTVTLNVKTEDNITVTGTYTGALPSRN